MVIMKIEMIEAPTWDPTEDFLEKLAPNLFYMNPAFFGGILIGTIIWTFYAWIREICDGNRSSDLPPEVCIQSVIFLTP